MPVTKVKSNWEGGNLVFRNAAGAEILKLDAVTATVQAAGVASTIRTRVTTAQVNSGLTLLPAIPGKKYRLIDATLIAIGGNAATADSVNIVGTQSASSATLIAAAVAALTRSAVVKPNSSNVTVLADGASFAACDENTAITIGKTGSNLATATHVDVSLSYVVE